MDSVFDQNTKFSLVLSRFCEKLDSPSLSQKLVLLMVSNSFQRFLIVNGTTFLLKSFVLSGFPCFSGLQWPIDGPFEPKKKAFCAKKVFLINDQAASSSHRFELLNQKNLFESKKLF